MVAPIDVRIVGDASGLNATLSAAGKDVSLFGDHLGISLPPKAALAVEATKKVAEIAVSTGKAAKDAAAEEKIFADAMAGLGVTTAEQTAKMDAAITASQKLAFTDTETRKALFAMQTATGDLDTSLALLTTAQDVARISGSSLGQAADAIAKAQAGQDTTLLRMIPGLEAGATATDTIANATRLAAGAADTYGESSSAAAAKARIGFSELQEEVGGALTPALENLGASLKPLIGSLLEIAATVLPPVLDLLSRMIDIVARVTGVIGDAVHAVQRLMDKLRELLGPIQDAIDKLGQIDLNPFNRAQGIIGGHTIQTETATARDVGTARTRGGEGGVVINVYGDPAVIEAKITKALRDYTRRNGIGTVFSPGRT